MGRPNKAPARSESDDEFLAKAAGLHLEGKLDEALAQLQRAATGSAHPARVHGATGYILYELGRFDEAAGEYEKLIALEPQRPAACFNLALCL